SSLVLRDALVALAKDLVTGQPAPAPYPFDPGDGVHLTSAAYGAGPSTATATSQPADVAHLGHTAFAWTGGFDGVDRPVDSPFVTIQRRGPHRAWVTVTDDLGMQILW